jgi:hypothetical protein
MKSLQAWMDANDETDRSLAPKVKLSHAQVVRIRNGTSRPSREAALRIEAVTAIPAADLIFGDAA